MLRFICLFSCCVSFAVQAADSKIYRWEKEDGTIIFSDQPIPGAKPIDLSAKVQNVAEMVTVKASEPAKAFTSKALTIGFKDLKDQDTVRNATGSLTVTAKLEFQLGITQKLNLLFDGQPVGTPQSSLQFQLSGIDRGEHQLQFQLLNQQGDVLTASKVITFYMHRPALPTSKPKPSPKN